MISPSTRLPPAGTVALAVALAGLSVALYSGVLHGGYFADDLNFLYDAPETKGLGYFLFGERVGVFYRPLEAAWLAGVQARLGMATWPIHLLNALAHGALAMVTFAMGRTLALGDGRSALAAVLVVVHQVAVYGVGGIDTVSQVNGALWGSLSVLLLYRVLVLRGEAWSGPTAYALGLASFAVALFCKETSVAYVALLGMLALVTFTRRPAEGEPVRSRRWAVVGGGIPFAVVTLVYLALRARAAQIQPSASDEQYAFWLGLNVLQNAVQFGLALVLPASTERLFSALKTGDWLGAGWRVGAACIYVLAVGVGLWRARAGRTTALLLAAAALAVVPAVFMGKVSELYVYNALPFVALLSALGVGALWAWTRERSVARVVLAVAVGAVLLGHTVATLGRVAQMEDNGARAQRLLADATPWIARAPAEGLVLLVNPEPTLTYSVFRLPHFETLRHGGEKRLIRLAGRPDVEVEIVDPGAPRPGGLALTLDADNRVVPLPARPAPDG